MFADRDKPTRVGIRLIVVAALVGLIVLLCQGRAIAGEPPLDEVARTLAAREPMAPQERVDTAASVLGAERKQRVLRAHSRFLEIGWEMITVASPRRVLSETRDFARELWSWREPLRNESEALEWLEPGVAPGADPELMHLYTKLHAREVKETSHVALDQAEAAAAHGQFEHAQARLDRACALGFAPDADRARGVASRLTELREAPAPTPAPAQPLNLEIADWEAPLAAALLAGHYDRALELGTQEPSAELARASARYLLGDPEAAVRSFEQLGERRDRVGELARTWSSHPEVNAQGAFAREKKGYRFTRMLGWLGGAKLAREGSSLSSRGYRAWRDSLTPFNVAFSMPNRIYRNWRPENEDLYDAAFEYVARFPDASDVESARLWLAQEVPLRTDWREKGWSGGHLSLGNPLTPFEHLTPEPILLTRGLLEGELVSDVSELHHALAGNGAVQIELESASSEGEPLPWRASLQLLAELGTVLEKHKTRSIGSDDTSALARLRELENDVRSGRRLVVEPAPVEAPSLAQRLTSTMFEGTSSRAGALLFGRGDEQFYALREFGGAHVSCPLNTVCLDRSPMLTGTFYSRVDMTALNFGVQTTFERAHFALGLSDGLPQVSLVLPIAYWIGLADWVPLEAQFQFGVDAISFGPHLNPEH